MYKIKTEGIYKDVSSNKEMFDFSNCSTIVQNTVMIQTT